MLQANLSPISLKDSEIHGCRSRPPEQGYPSPPSGKGPPAGSTCSEKTRLDPRESAGLGKMGRDQPDRQREQARHRLRGGRLPQYRRVLGEEARHLHDHGRHLHAGLRLLQREDRNAQGAGSNEPENVAIAVQKLGLEHVVITSVDRDDLADGGAQHFADVILAIRARSPGTTIEILTPDFLRKPGALEIVVAAKPDVFNHNLETVPGLYLKIRPGARYFHSLRLLQRVKELDPTMFTKSGVMVGLGEERDQVLQLMDDLRSADVDFLTIGQYLQPTRKHHKVEAYVTPEEFKSYETVAYTKGFLMVSSSPLTRSSHHAGDDFARLRAAREKKLLAAAE